MVVDAASGIMDRVKLLERDLTRRLFYLAMLALAVGGMVIAITNGRTSPTALSDREAAIDALVPNQGADVLRQSTVGIDVAEGYMARLIVNGVQIPDDQIDADMGLGRFFFTPGPGQVIETLNGGQNCVVALYWLAAAGSESAESTRWCFSAA